MNIELELLIALSCGLSGLLCGWFLRQPVSLVVSAATPLEDQSNVDRDKLEMIANQLRRVTSHMEANVDAHQTKIREVSDELIESEGSIDDDTMFDAVSSLVAANEKMQERLVAAKDRLQEQARAIESAEELALTDGLTGLRNRRAFDCHAADRLAIVERDEYPTTLMMIDVDHFREFNDTYGHLTGDEVLRHVADLLKSSFAENGMVARYGGEEFAVILEDLSLDEIKERAEEIRIDLGNRDFLVGGRALRITASAGLAQLAPNESLDAWIERADAALYRAKNAGRNRSFWMDGNQARPLTPDEPSSEDSIESKLNQSSQQSRPADQSTEASDGDEGTFAMRTLEQLGEVMTSTLAKMQAEHLPFCVVAVRMIGEHDNARQNTALKGIHRSIQGLDPERTGFDDESTFVICLPNTTENIAREHANAAQDAIRELSTQVGQDHAENIQTWVTCANAEETFEQLLTRTLQSESSEDQATPQ